MLLQRLPRALRPLQVSSHVQLAAPQQMHALKMSAASEGAKPAAWNAEKAHDYFNIVSTSLMAVLTVASHVKRSYNLPLAIIVCCYLAVDAVWIALQPEIVSESGGGGYTLIGHHIAAFIVAAHGATWALHTQYVCWMSVVEINTLILMLKRTVGEGPALLASLLDKLFLASWVGTRLVWFPFVAVWVTFMGGYPSLARRLLCGGCAAVLTALQVVWTWNFCVPEHRQVTLY